MTNSSELRCVIEAIITSVPGNMFHNRALTALAAIVRESGDIQSEGLMVRWGQRPSEAAQVEAVESALMRVNGTSENDALIFADCAECGSALGSFHRAECGKRVFEHPCVVSDDTVADDALDMDEPFDCGYCGREELTCSMDPCPDVIADRGEPNDPREDR